MSGIDEYCSNDVQYVLRLVQHYKDCLMYIREDMLTKLREGTCRVIFKKVNGEERDMRCTLEVRNIPEEQRPKVGSEYADSVIRAYDVDKGEWRSFKVENVVSFSPI